MSEFTNHAHISPHGDKWINDKTFRFYINNNLTGDYIEIPEGFVFDGCSVFCPFGQSVEPDTITSCLIHDFMWSEQKYGFWYSNYVFLKAMHIDGVKPFKRFRYYLGVTLLGWVIWFIKVWKKL